MSKTLVRTAIFGNLKICNRIIHKPIPRPMETLTMMKHKDVLQSAQHHSSIPVAIPKSTRYKEDKTK